MKQLQDIQRRTFIGLIGALLALAFRSAPVEPEIHRWLRSRGYVPHPTRRTWGHPDLGVEVTNELVDDPILDPIFRKIVIDTESEARTARAGGILGRSI